jgi:hypothetical protein
VIARPAGARRIKLLADSEATVARISSGRGRSGRPAGVEAVIASRVIKKGKAEEEAAEE